MIQRQEAIVYYAPTVRRRYFTKKAAIRAEARALILRRYPTEHPEYEEIGVQTSSGWHWSQLEQSEKLFRRVCRMVANASK